MNQGKINKLLSLSGFLFFLGVVMILMATSHHDTQIEILQAQVDRRDEVIRGQLIKISHLQESSKRRGREIQYQRLEIMRYKNDLKAIQNKYIRCVNAKANGKE